MGCGSSAATRTAAQPAPKAKRTSIHSIKETNGHAHRRKESVQNGTSSKQKRGNDTPSLEANGHLLNSHVETPNNNTVSETRGDRVQRDPSVASVNKSANSATTTTEGRETRTVQEQVNGDIPVQEISHSKATEDEARPVVIESSSAVGDEGVTMITSGDDKILEVKKETGVTDAQGGDNAGTEEVESVKHRVPSKPCLSGENDSLAHRDTSEVGKEVVASNETNKDIAPGTTETSQGNSGSNHNLSDTRRTSQRTTLPNHNGASEASLSGEKDTVSHINTNVVQSSNKDASQESVTSKKYTSFGPDHNQTNASMTVNEFSNVPSEASLPGENDSLPYGNSNEGQPSNKDISQGSLPGNKYTASEQDENQRKGSMTVSEFFGAPSDAELHLSNQRLGFSEQNFLPSTAEAEQPDEPNEIVRRESADGKETAVVENIEVRDRADPVLTRRDSSTSTDTDPDRICTVTANVKIGSLEHISGHKTVTLTGSVYRLPREDDSASPKPGDKIGIVKGDVITVPGDNETGEKIAILRGDLSAVSEEAASNGLIATASIDVLSCNLREKLATITADVAPSDDPEPQSGVISGEVLAASERGSYDDKIGSLSGRVVALTFGEGVNVPC